MGTRYPVLEAHEELESHASLLNAQVGLARCYLRSSPFLDPVRFEPVAEIARLQPAIATDS